MGEVEKEGPKSEERKIAIVPCNHLATVLLLHLVKLELFTNGVARMWNRNSEWKG